MAAWHVRTDLRSESQQRASEQPCRAAGRGRATVAPSVADLGRRRTAHIYTMEDLVEPPMTPMTPYATYTDGLVGQQPRGDVTLSRETKPNTQHLTPNTQNNHRPTPSSRRSRRASPSCRRSARAPRLVVGALHAYMPREGGVDTDRQTDQIQIHVRETPPLGARTLAL